MEKSWWSILNVNTNVVWDDQAMPKKKKGKKYKVILWLFTETLNEPPSGTICWFLSCYSKTVFLRDDQDHRIKLGQGPYWSHKSQGSSSKRLTQWCQLERGQGYFYSPFISVLWETSMKFTLLLEGEAIKSGGNCFFQKTSSGWQQKLACA